MSCASNKRGLHKTEGLAQVSGKVQHMVAGTWAGTRDGRAHRPLNKCIKRSELPSGQHDINYLECIVANPSPKQKMAAEN